MKGLVFLELVKMAEANFGEDKVDEVISAAPLPSGGAYTSVGCYDCAELLTLIKAFSEASDIAPRELERRFGHWVMDAFRKGYPDLFLQYGTASEMLEAIEEDIHVEVRKLYPDAELPSIKTVRQEDGRILVRYRSDRPLAAFCLGLIEACFSEFSEKATVKMDDKTAAGHGEAVFTINRE